MTRIEFHDWSFDASPKDTEKIHSRRDSGAEECGCLNCRNFSTARSEVFPESFIQFLQSLGIDSTKETEVYEIHELSPGVHYYGGWFHAIGSIVEDGIDLITLDNDFRVFISSKRDILPAGFADKPVIQVDFYGSVPWVLDEPPESK